MTTIKELKAEIKKKNCHICGKEDECKFTIVISTITCLDVCKDCMNLYANHRYDELIDRLNRNTQAI